jgi:hypothetical protein
MFYECSRAPSTSLIAGLPAPPRQGPKVSRANLLSRRPDDAQNRGTTPGSLKMSANVPASSAACPKAAAPARMPHRLAFAVCLTVLLCGTAISARGEDGPMASAPLPPPLPAAPPATGLQQPQGGPSPASQRVLPKSRPPADSGTQAAHLHKRNHGSHHIDHSAHAARGQKRDSRGATGNIEHREAPPAPRVASAMIPPPAPLPFPYGYFPGAPPAYGYAPVYPPPWPPGPALPR